MDRHGPAGLAMTIRDMIHDAMTRMKLKGRMKKIFFFFLILLAGAVHDASAVSDKIYKDIETFSRILEIIDKQYVNTIDEKKVMEGAIHGMLYSLDPHTVYFTPENYKDFKSDTKGRFGGIGLEVSMKDGILTVVAPIEGSPADRAGIKSGDKILSIDGQSTKRMNLMDAVRLMRGSSGKKVVLSIWPEGKGKPIIVTLAREVIKIDSVRTEDLGDGYGLFRITTFQDDTTTSLKKAMEKFAGAQAGGLKGIILDLRDNPGGLLSEAIAVSDLFIKDGVIVSTKGRDKVMEVNRARTDDPYEKTPVVVLINGGTASAAEIVSGALQDYGRGKLIGSRTFGKGSVQTVVNLDDGAALKFTIAHYYTPKNRMIDGKGIDPDVLVDEKKYRKSLGEKVEDEKSSVKKNGDDEMSDGEEVSPPTKGKRKKITLQEFKDYQKNEALTILKAMK